MVVNAQINATESPPANDENDAHRPRRTKDDILNPEKVKEEKLRSRDVLDDVLNAVRVFDVIFENVVLFPLREFEFDGCVALRTRDTNARVL